MRGSLLALGLSVATVSSIAALAAPAPTLRADLTLLPKNGGDQDDMTFWTDRADPSRSLVITSDKKMGRLHVYDLGGHVLGGQSLPAPGNIDTRQGVRLGGRVLDLVAVNSRGEGKVAVFTVDAKARSLSRVDDGGISTGAEENYGSALCVARERLFVFTTTKSGRVTEFELTTRPDGRIAGRSVRTLSVGSIAEGMVCDDDQGAAFLAEENRGIWKLPIDPSDPAKPALIASVGDASGLTADVEGLALYREPGQPTAGYLVASSQGVDRFKIYQRSAPYAYVGDFAIEGVKHTDGIAIAAQGMGERFPRGVLAAHNGARTPCPVVLVDWARIAAVLPSQRRSR